MNQVTQIILEGESPTLRFGLVNFDIQRQPLEMFYKERCS